MSDKKYGLILPDKSKTQPTFQAARNVFGNDSDSDDGSKRKITISSTTVQKKQIKLAQEKAVFEDPTVYQYDEVYDSMTKEIEKKKIIIKSDKTPKYIEKLIKTANKRKIENERRIERQVQKERENEGEEFADKEVFVTTAYKKKLEEMRLEEEKEKYEEYLESIGDVTKQKDLGGFYRHLYEQKLGPKDTEQTKSKENDKIAGDSPTKTTTTKLQNPRNYRKRKVSNDQKLSDGEIDDSEEEINRCNLEDIKISKKSKQNENIDADSDFSIDESSDEEVPDKDGVGKENGVEKENVEETKETNSEIGKPVQIIPKQELEEPKIKIDIWKKRCVGELFDQALKRYYERKAARCNSV